MRAAVIQDGKLVVAERPDPVPSDGEVLVRVHAAGLNGADIQQAAGRYPAPPGVPQDIPGMELAGEIVASGPRAERFSIGDRVMAIVGGGAQAELCVVNERMLMAVPDSVSWSQAGGFPEAFITAHDALIGQAGLQSGERLLVHGAAGGVGTAAVQIGRLTGARVTATVRSAEHREQVAELGATAIAPDNFAERGPFDVILELVGAIHLADNLSALETGGRIVVIGTGAGAKAEINLGVVMVKRARLSGSTLRNRPPELKALATRGVERSLLPAFASGRLRVPIAATFGLDSVQAAYDRFTAGSKFGKVVLAADHVG